MSKKIEVSDEDDEFLTILEKAVRQVFKSRDATPAEKLQAVNAGVKLLAIRYKIGGGDEKGFFDK